VGYFTCWLAHLAKGRELSGIMIDANPSAVEEAQWHARANGWSYVYALHGIVGEGSDGTAKDFFIYESNICSMTQLPDVEAMGLKGKWTKISVPCLRLEEHWRQRFGDARCHLLKVDIEGSEMDFLKKERSFLARVDCILLEWHKWRVRLDEVTAFLAKEGFGLTKVLEENEQMGTAVFKLRVEG
jgi:FkbM family methyltransferase